VATTRAKGWALVVLGLAIALPAGSIFAVITNVIPLAAIAPANVRVTGPVEADARAFVSFGLAALLGVAVFAQGVAYLKRGRASWRLAAALLGIGALGLLVGALLR